MASHFKIKQKISNSLCSSKIMKQTHSYNCNEHLFIFGFIDDVVVATEHILMSQIFFVNI